MTQTAAEQKDAENKAELEQQQQAKIEGQADTVARMDLPPVRCSCGLDHKGANYNELINPVSGFIDLSKLGVRAEYVTI